MIVYILDKITLKIKDVIETSKFELSYDEETNSKSSIVLPKIPNASQNDFVIVKSINKTKYQGIITEIQGEKDSNQSKLIIKDISNIFNREIYVDGESAMETSLEDFLFYTINKFFKQGDDDQLIAMPFISITQTTQTSVTEPINDNDGIYNFHTFMTNCRQNKNISVDFELKQEELDVLIHNIGNQDVIKIDTTNNDVINYNKVYEMDITSRVTVKCGDTGNILNYYLKTDRTITTNKNDLNRVNGELKTIYVDEESKAEEQATNIFKGNRYNHLVEFEIRQDSKLVNIDDLTIGRPIKIKTNDGILDSYISSISMENSSNYIHYKSGNIRVDLIDKLKQEPYKIGVNKVDKSSIKSVTTSGQNKTYSCDYINKFTSYSTEEQVIGKWIDGKPLYRKTIQGTYQTNSTRSIVDLVGTVDTLINSYGAYSPNESKPRHQIGSSMINTGGGIDAYSEIRLSASNVIQAVFSTPQSSYQGLMGSFDITIEYTKTTD